MDGWIDVLGVACANECSDSRIQKRGLILWSWVTGSESPGMDAGT